MYNAPTSAFLAGRRHRMAGLTLVELLIVLTIAGILLGIGMASFNGISKTSRVAGEINGLLGDMQFARAEAVKEGQSVVVCVSVNGTDCSASNTNWNQGWIVFPDANNTHSTGGNANLVLRAQPAFKGTDTLTDSATSYISFDREGLALGFGGSVLKLHDSTNNATFTRCLQITPVGSVSVVQPSTLAACT